MGTVWQQDTKPFLEHSTEQDVSTHYLFCLTESAGDVLKMRYTNIACSGGNPELHDRQSRCGSRSKHKQQRPMHAHYFQGQPHSQVPTYILPTLVSRDLTECARYGQQKKNVAQIWPWNIP